MSRPTVSRDSLESNFIGKLSQHLKSVKDTTDTAEIDWFQTAFLIFFPHIKFSHKITQMIEQHWSLYSNPSNDLKARI